jgi:hypothetical protein
MFTRLHTTEGPVSLPNSGVLNSATGPRPQPPAEPEPEPEPAPAPRPRLRVPHVPAGAHRRKRAA